MTAQHQTFELWLAALDTAAHTDWRGDINSPTYARWDGRVGYTDRWGVFHQTGERKCRIAVYCAYPEAGSWPSGECKGCTEPHELAGAGSQP